MIINKPDGSPESALAVLGNTSLDGQLAVTGKSTLAAVDAGDTTLDSLIVDGLTELRAPTTIKVDASGTDVALTLSGPANGVNNLGAALAVSGDINFNSAVGQSGELSLGGPIAFTNVARFPAGIEVTGGNVVLAGPDAGTGFPGANLIVGGTTDLNGQVTVDANMEVKQDLTVDGLLTANMAKVLQDLEVSPGGRGGRAAGGAGEGGLKQCSRCAPNLRCACCCWLPLHAGPASAPAASHCLTTHTRPCLPLPARSRCWTPSPATRSPPPPLPASPTAT